MKVKEEERATVVQLADMPFVRRVRAEGDMVKAWKTYSSGYNSTLNSTSDISFGSQNANKFQIL